MRALGGSALSPRAATRQPRSPIDPSTRQLALWRMTLRIRYALIATGAAFTLVLTTSNGSERFWLAAVLVGLVLPYNAAYDLIMRRTGVLPPLVAYTDQVIVVGAIALTPSHTPEILLVMVALDATSAVSFGRRVAGSAAVIGAFGAALALVARGETEMFAPFAVYLLAAAFIVAVAGGVAELERSLRNRYAELVGGVDAIVWEQLTRHPSTLYVSDAAVEILGYPRGDWQQPGFWSRIVHPEDREWATAAYRSAIRRGEALEIEYRFIAADGHVVHLHDHMRVDTDADGRVLAVRGVALDVTDRRAAEEQANQYVNLVERIQLAMFVFQLTNHGEHESMQLVAINPEAQAVTKLVADDAVGHTLRELLDRPDSGPWVERLAQVVRSGEGFVADEVELRPGSGGRVYSAHAFPLPGDAVGVSLHDVTARVMAAEVLRRQALHDSLTDLGNRAMLHERLKAALARSQADGSAIALLVMDLDQFKEVNDALGHDHGDGLLVELSRRLQRVLHDVDLVARLGGDEFAVLLTERVSEDSAVAVARRILRALEHPFQLGGITLQASGSIGIALHPNHAPDAETLVQRADVAMYTAKRSGDGCAVYSPEHDQSSVRRLSLLGELRRAIEHGNLRLHYQPTVDLSDGSVRGTEALVRWAHPELGLVLPSQFIELAELSGQIGALTRWVLDSAVAQLAAWRKRGIDLSVSVNLSVRDLHDADLVRWLSRVLAHRDVPADRLQMELTESQLMDDPPLAMEVMHKLRSLGVSTSVDDFGTGYSSLSYLKHLPIDELKIDRSFVGNMARDASDRAIVRSTIDLSHDLGLRVVAEGVEDGESLRLLAQLGCDRAQGFFLAEPMRADQLVRWLADPMQRQRLRSAVGPPEWGLAEVAR